MYGQMDRYIKRYVQKKAYTEIYMYINGEPWIGGQSLKGMYRERYKFIDRRIDSQMYIATYGSMYRYIHSYYIYISIYKTISNVGGHRWGLSSCCLGVGSCLSGVY